MYLHEYASPREAYRQLADYIRFYNFERPHQALDYLTPHARAVHYAYLHGLTISALSASAAWPRYGSPHASAIVFKRE